MKDKQIINLLSSRNMVIPLYMFKEYTKLDIELEAFIFLMYLYNLDDKCVFNPNKFSEDLNYPVNKIMEFIGTLTSKGLVKVEVIKNDKGLMEEVVMLEGFYNKLSLIFMDEANKSSKDPSNIFTLIEKEFGRTLSPMEYEIIRAWIDNNMSEELITEAVKEANYYGVPKLSYIDKILYEWGKLGIKTVQDVEENRKKRVKQNDQVTDVDMDIVDWNWFDEDE